MKKLLTACAVAGFSAAVFGDVVAANVVGYATRDINNKFKMAAAQFETCDGQEVALNGAVSVPSSAAVQCWADPYDDYENIEGWQDSAPQIQVPVVGRTGYNYYYYVKDARDLDSGENAGEAWADIDGYYTTDAIPAAYGIWVRGFVDGDEVVEDTKFTFNGAVNGDSTQTLQAENMFKLRSIPFPVNATLNGAICDWGKFITSVQCWADPYDDYENIDGWQDVAPQIQVPVIGRTGYNYYYFVKDARDLDSGENAGEAWADIDGYYTTDSIPAAYGIWINIRSDSTEIPLNNPLNK